MAELLWISLQCAGVPNEVASMTVLLVVTWGTQSDDKINHLKPQVTLI